MEPKEPVEVEFIEKEEEGRKVKELDIKDYVRDIEAHDFEGMWIPVPNCPGFEVQVAYIGKDKLIKLGEKTMRPRKGFRIRPAVSDAEGEKFLRAYVNKAIVNWRGLTPENLIRLIPVIQNKEGKLPEEFKCHIGNKLLLVKKSLTFDVWLDEVCTDVELYNRAQAKLEVDNLKEA